MITINKMVADSIVITTGPVVKRETYIKFSDGTEFYDVIEFPDGLDGIFDLRTAVKYGWTDEGDDGYDGEPSWDNKQPIEVILGSNVTNIGNYAFYNCSGLMIVAIPDGVTSIGQSAFYYCGGMTSMTIPDSVTSIDWWAFDYCGLTSVTFSGKDMATVQGMANYSQWELPSGCVIHCTDGDITLS